MDDYVHCARLAVLVIQVQDMKLFEKLFPTPSNYIFRNEPLQCIAYVKKVKIF